MNSLAGKILQWAKRQGTFFRPDAFAACDVSELGSEDQIALAISSLRDMELLDSEPTIDGVYWFKRHEGFPSEMTQPSIESIAGAIARSRNARLVVSERYARGHCGIEERYSAEVPFIVAMPGIDKVTTFGIRDGQPLIVAEPASEIALAHETVLSHLIVQGFRRLVEEDRRDEIEAAVNHIPFGLHPNALKEHAALARIELDEPFLPILERIICVAEKHQADKQALPATSAPKGWAPPEAYGGPTVAGAWRLVPVDFGGIEYRAIFGGDLFSHPDMATPSRNWRSSPVVWLDKQAGWARTYSRLYRLLPQQRSPDSLS